MPVAIILLDYLLKKAAHMNLTGLTKQEQAACLSFLKAMLTTVVIALLALRSIVESCRTINRTSSRWFMTIVVTGHAKNTAVEFTEFGLSKVIGVSILFNRYWYHRRNYQSFRIASRYDCSS